MIRDRLVRLEKRVSELPSPPDETRVSEDDLVRLLIEHPDLQRTLDAIREEYGSEREDDALRDPRMISTIDKLDRLFHEKFPGKVIS